MSKRNETGKKKKQQQQIQQEEIANSQIEPEPVIVIPTCSLCGFIGKPEDFIEATCSNNHSFCFKCLYKHFFLNINEILNDITEKRIINMKCLICENKEDCGKISLTTDEFLEKQQLFYMSLNKNFNATLEPCPMHNNPIINYCASCDIFICKFCALNEHKEHNVTTITDKENEIKTKLTALPLKRSTIFGELMKELNNKNISFYEEITTRTMSEIDKLISLLNQLKVSFEDKMKQLKQQYETLEKIINESYGNYYEELTTLDVNYGIPYLDFLNEINEEFKEIKLNVSPTIYQEILLMKGKISEMSIAEKIASTVKIGFSFDKIREYQCIKTLKDHTDYIRSIVQTEKKLITCSDDKLIKIYDMENDYKVIQTLKGHTDAILVLCSVNINKLISGSEDKLIKIWESKSSEYKCTYTLKGHTAGITKLIAYAEGKKFVSASNDNTLRLWDSKNDYKTSVVIQAHSSKITSMLFHNDSLITSSHDKTIKVFDLNLNNKNTYIFKEHTDIINQIILLPTEPLIIISASVDCHFNAYSLGEEESKMVTRIKGHSMEITKLFEMNGGIFASIGKDKLIKIWDTNNQYKCICTIAAHKWEIYSLIFYEDGELIYSCSQDKTIRGWKIKNWNDYQKENNQMLKTKCVGILKGHERDVVMVTMLNNGEVLSISNDLSLKLWRDS